ncbi:MAG TPA: dephospho-CoA kinase [Actinophytocola sp.]|uniref:dephospho-CoA kinase n=1 Tax=Actinophytocola sp. TaxID=1872138 RepID=UPI002DDCE270|nr:dephospho-CoA kinase [Actinophytocola sp.]HEV2780134.1 dephospho-CoA kinase [Actinophytocola sp.]
MLRVGLTGGIGSGKSTVAGRLTEHGAVVIDSDRLAREVVAPGTDGLAEIVAAFGSGVLAADGSLDRAKLAATVFSDDTARKRLNAIVHPRVGARTAELMAEAPADAIVVHDVPLLVENGLAPNYHLVIVVDAPVEIRVHRLVTARDMSEADVRARIASQATEEARRAAADVWLDNAGARDEILAAVDALWADRLVRYEANVRLRRRARYGPPRLHDPDPTWPVQAERLAARIRRAAGDKALRVDHIGSTAVPGLPAKDVIDLQLTVSTLDDADAVADPLTEAGFVFRPGVDQDQVHAAYPDAAQWRRRYHNSADPGRVANLHVRAHGSPGWRFALQFRDWLRADPDIRAEYLAVKRELAARYATDEGTARYADAKEPWFAEVYPRMAEWARRTGWSAGTP